MDEHNGRKFQAEQRKTRQLTGLALLFALALVLSFLESLLPPPPIPVPGVKYGLSNIAVMYALFFWDKRSATLIALLKAAFVLAMRGALAAALSLGGGLFSIALMTLLLYASKNRISYLLLSIAGGIAHNLAQYLIISLVYKGTSIITILPVLLLSGMIAGMITAIVLQAVLPALKRTGLTGKSTQSDKQTQKEKE